MDQAEWTKKTNTAIGWIEQGNKTLFELLCRTNQGKFPAQLNLEMLLMDATLLRIRSEFERMFPLPDQRFLPATEEQKKLLLLVMQSAETLHEGVEDLKIKAAKIKPGRKPSLGYLFWFSAAALITFLLLTIGGFITHYFS